MPAVSAFVAVLALGAAAAVDAQALSWRTGHSVAAGAGNDSNFRFRASDTESVQSASVSVAGNVAARRPGLSLELRPELRALRYSDDAEADRNDAFMTAGVVLDQRQRTLRIGGRYARESTLTSEFEASGLLGDVERVQRGGDLGYSRTLGPKRSINVTAASFDTLYDAAAASAYGDYTFRTLELGQRKAIDEHTSWSLVARKSFVDATFATGGSTTTALSSSWSRRFSPYLSASLGIGAFVVESRATGAGDPSASLNFGIVRQGLRWSASASAARDVRPQTGGVLLVEDVVTLAAQRRLGQSASIGLQLRGARVSSALAPFFDYDRTYARFGANVSWRMARRLELRATVDERAENSSFAPRATGLATSVSVTYRSG